MTRHITKMTIDDALHYSAADKERLLAQYPTQSERMARLYGEPALGTGRVFPFEEADIAIAPFPIPAHWPQIIGIDFGVDHPTAAVRLAWDRDGDTVYATHCYRVSAAEVMEATGQWAGTAVHAAAIKAWGDWIPVAWPHDGLQRDRNSGEALSQIYRNAGLNMLPDRAQFADGRGSSVEAGVTEMADRFQQGRLKIFHGLAPLFEEIRMYHRKDGMLVKVRDDAISACRYGLVMLRFAETKPAPVNSGPRLLPDYAVYGF